MTELRRAALYARVSTERQAGEQQTSIPDQLRRDRKVCESYGWEIVGEYVDPGVSGEALEERPEMQRLLRDVEAGRIDVVVAIDLDRVGRDEFVFAQIFDTLDTAEVWVHADGQLYDPDNPTQRMTRGIKAVVSSHARRALLQTMANGQRARALVGGWPGGTPPYGRRLVWPPAPDGKRPKAMVELDPDEVAVILRATELLVDGDGSGRPLDTGDVAARLNAVGSRTRGGSGAPDKRVPRPWAADTLLWILRSRTLMGELVWGKPQKPGRAHQARTRTRKDGTPYYGEPVRLQLEPILTEVEWNELQRALDRRATETRSASRAYPLSGARSHCGGRFQGVYRNDRDSRSYRCSGRKRRADEGPRCSCPYLPADTVEGAVWGKVVALLSDRARLEQMAADFASLRRRQAPEAPAQLRKVQAQAKQLEQARTTRVADALKAGLAPELLAGAVAQIEDELAALAAEQARLQALVDDAGQADAAVLSVGELADRAAAVLPRMGAADQRRVLRLLGVQVAALDPSATPAMQVTGHLPAGGGAFLAHPVTPTG